MDESIGQQALQAIGATRPMLTGLRLARDCVGIPERTILHAGPAFREGNISRPVRNSAMVAAVFEGWAKDFAAAGVMLDKGEIHLAPAQDFNAVAPLAAVISPSMWVQVVCDESRPGALESYSALNGGSVAALRLGQCTEHALSNLRWLNADFAPVLRDAIRRPIALIPIAQHALEHGDDCHGRTQEGTAQLRRSLMEIMPALKNEPSALAFLDASPSFFLNLWMAACKTMMQAAVFPGSDAITAIGGNGVDFGLQVGGMPGVWWTAPGEPPVGRLEAGFASQDALPAIGDSAVVDAMGFGCMVMHYAPAQFQALSGFMPEESQSLGKSILLGLHGGFDKLDVRVACSVGRAAASNKALPIALGILDIKGEKGRIGGGIAQVPMELMNKAFSELKKQATTTTISSST